MIVVGLTGSIGMGKSATAKMFADLGAAVQDADAVVAQLYSPGGEAVAPVLAEFPAAKGDSGGVDRVRLSGLLAEEPGLLEKLEAIVHPLVANYRDAFLAAERARGTKVAVLEIPLLFETGGEKKVDQTVVVTAPPQMQRLRVLARPGMTAEKFEQILARQTPDAEKRARADFIIDTGQGLDNARRQVADIMAKLAGIGERKH